MEEAFRIFRHHPLNRDVIGLLYYYAYNLELTGRYDEEARVLAIMKPMIQHYDWGNTSPIVQKSCRDNLSSIAMARSLTTTSPCFVFAATLDAVVGTVIVQLYLDLGLF